MCIVKSESHVGNGCISTCKNINTLFFIYLRLNLPKFAAYNKEHCTEYSISQYNNSCSMNKLEEISAMILIILCSDRQERKFIQ